MVDLLNKRGGIAKFWVASLTILWLLMAGSSVKAHRWHRHGDSPDRHDEAGGVDPAKPLGNGRVRLVALQTGTAEKPSIAEYFEHFENVRVRWDSRWLIIESNGLPNHQMMVGIRSWQQQVPLPQPFTGSNAWKIPLQPTLARTPINAKRTPFRGAIALAVNGVPIFSALNNRGEDAFLAGELDQWGGHCGRGDDYHYHIAPLHLEEVVGKGNPIGFALDGFPIYGLTKADGSPVGKLDELNGQFDANGNYHYHATKAYPYINGGVRGVVDFRNGEISTQPRDAPVRPGQPPLRGAVITDFAYSPEKSVLTYRLQGKTGKISYRAIGENRFEFTFVEPNGRQRSETYERRTRPDRGQDRRPPPRRPGQPQ